MSSFEASVSGGMMAGPMRARNVDVPAKALRGPFFHGTPHDRWAEKILESGEVRPRAKSRVVRDKKGAHAAPVQGRVYVTPYLEEAWTYAEPGGRLDVPSGSKYGWVFELDPADFRDLEPDEDTLGRAASAAVRGCDEVYREPYLAAFCAQPMGTINNFRDWVRGHVTPLQFDSLRSPSVALIARVGKKLLAKMSATDRRRWIEQGGAVSHAGALPIRRAWRIPAREFRSPFVSPRRFRKVAEMVPLRNPDEPTAPAQRVFSALMAWR